jgi:hypothetical protein
LDERGGSVCHDPEIVSKIVFIGVVNVQIDTLFYRHVLIASLLNLPKSVIPAGARKRFAHSSVVKVAASIMAMACFQPATYRPSTR